MRRVYAQVHWLIGPYSHFEVREGEDERKKQTIEEAKLELNMHSGLSKRLACYLIPKIAMILCVDCPVFVDDTRSERHVLPQASAFRWNWIL